MYRALQAMAAAIAGLASAQNLAAQEIEELIAEQIGKYSIVIRQECRVIHQIVEDMDYVVCNDGGKRKGGMQTLCIPCSSKAEAIEEVRAIHKTRIAHGYKLVVKDPWINLETG